MRDQKIIELVGSAAAAGARPDFADLLRRIEADGKQSSAPQMTATRSGFGKIIAYTAAGVAAAAALGTISYVGLSMGAKSSESFAADAECEAPMASETFSEDNSWAESFDSEAVLDQSESEPLSPEEDEEPASDSDVSGSDVSEDGGVN